jgi:hypothetical protein
MFFAIDTGSDDIELFFDSQIIDGGPRILRLQGDHCRIRIMLYLLEEGLDRDSVPPTLRRFTITITSFQPRYR